MQITEYLDQKKVKYQVCSHRPAFTAQQIAAEEHVSGMDVAKPVIVQADGKYYMCVLPACCKVDLEMLRGVLGAGELGISCGLDPFGSAFEFVLRRNVPYRTMEPLVSSGL